MQTPRPTLISETVLPLRLSGTVIRGFGRGGKQLNCPTANLDERAVKSIPDQVQSGVYSGLAALNHGSFRPMVMSIGYNLQFEQRTKTAEVHILHSFDEDFYGSTLDVVVLHFLRPMLAFKSLAIERDKADTWDYLKANQTSIDRYLTELGSECQWK